MAELGRLFADSDGERRGIDLVHRVHVPRSALGRTEGWRVPVPKRLPAGDSERARVIRPEDPEDEILIFLPARLPPGAVLRLRGQGARDVSGDPGDLLLEIVVLPARLPRPIVWALFALLLALGLFVLFY